MKLENLTDHVVADTSTQNSTRSCVFGGVSLGSNVVAIDSGDSLDVGRMLRKTLESHFGLAVQYFFLTHTHTDHRKGMDAFKDVTLVTSSKCIENMSRSVKLSRWSVESFDESFSLRDDIKIEFHITAGHSVGTSVAYVPDDRVLFGGDLFITKPVNFGLPFMGFYQNRPKRDGNPDEYIAAYKRFLDWGVEIIVPGHGHIVQNAEPYLENQIRFFEDLRTFIVSEIKDGKSIDEIELPRLDLIQQAFDDVENHPKRSYAKRWLNNYIDVLKKSFLSYYSQDS